MCQQAWEPLKEKKKQIKKLRSVNISLLRLSQNGAKPNPNDFVEPSHSQELGRR